MAVSAPFRMTLVGARSLARQVGSSQPGADENGVIGAGVGQAQAQVHRAGLLALVAFVDAVHDHGIRVAPQQVAGDLTGGEGGRGIACARVDDQHDVDVVVAEMIDDLVAARAERLDERRDEAVAAAPGALLDTVADGDLHAPASGAAGLRRTRTCVV